MEGIRLIRSINITDTHGKTTVLILPGICVQSGEMPASERESPSCPRFEGSSVFSLEHTVRENLFLSGSIIRMKLREIDPK